MSSKRINAFRTELIAAIPRFPNNRASLRSIESKTLTDLFITYIGWRLRYVATRPRKVVGRSNLTGDPCTAALNPNIDAFIAAVEAGTDLTPYLSMIPRTRGYTPATASGTLNTWADKDLLLNVMGLHHFHLDLPTAAERRIDEVLFASVTRDTFEILGLFDHAAFEHEDGGTMTPERAKLWCAYESRESAGTLPGQLSIGGYANIGITLSGHSMAVVRAAQRHVDILREIDPKLDDAAYVKTLFGHLPIPAKPKLEWCYRHLDLGLFDKSAAFFVLLERGPN